VTSEELVDERLYREHLCYLCLAVVSDTDGHKWRVWRDEGRHYLYLHSECSRRVRAICRSPVRRRLDRLLPALRAMRLTQERPQS
jgi:hypothetical protein